MDLLRGLQAPAWIVGIARGVVEAALMGALVMAADAVQSGALPAEYAPFAAIAIVVIRTAEGLVDQIDPQKKRSPA